MREGGSIQLQRYRRAREHGHARADAAAYADIPVEEAEMIDIDEGFVPLPTKGKRK